MKKLTRLLLINWYGYSFELIDFGMINFLTGKTASGKSTIIDALQLVLLGETSGNFFNKAANKDSHRTLRSYLYGENGDNGDTGFNYLREGPFTSYVALEIEDTEKGKTQLIGIGADCHEDLNFDTQWFVVHNHGIPETNFINPKTETPYRITELKKYFSSQPEKWNVEFCQSNKRYRDVTLSVFGNIKDKYRTLLKKSVPFSPITDIEKFITESVCDVKNEIHVEEMQSDIRQYKSLQDDIERTEKRVDALEEISAVSGEFDSAVARKLQQEYIVIRAEQDEKKAELLRLKQSAEKKESDLQEIRSQIQSLTEEISSFGQTLEDKKKEYFSSDAVKKRDELEEKIRRQDLEIDEIEKRIQQAVRNT
ncbi:MAG: ATP-binding protein, partial [Eubacterium sp.]